jgi:hypothetical protein
MRKAKPVNQSAQRWKLGEMPWEPVQISGRQEFQRFIAGLIEHWDMNDYEKLVLAYVAERIWRLGRCRCSLNTMIRETKPTIAKDAPATISKNKELILHAHHDYVSDAIESLVKLGLIDWQDAQIDELGDGYFEWQDRVYEQSHEILILNEALASLLKTGALK